MAQKRKSTDPLGLQGSGFDLLGKLANPETYRAINNIGKPKPPGPKANPKMSRDQISKSAAGLGYTMGKDGSFTKISPPPTKKPATGKGLGGHRGS